MLALIRSVEHWRHYLLGTNFVVWTDHKPLCGYNQLPTLSDRQARWLDTLQSYSGMEIRYLKGKSNVVADALSRSAPTFTVRKSQQTKSSTKTRPLVNAPCKDTIAK